MLPRMIYYLSECDGIRVIMGDKKNGLHLIFSLLTEGQREKTGLNKLLKQKTILRLKLLFKRRRSSGEPLNVCLNVQRPVFWF